MAYTTVVDLKNYLGVSGSGDDTLLGDLIDRAQAAIDTYCRRTFEAVTATRYYQESETDGDLLWLDDDLYSVTTLTNGDADGTAITDYWLLPRNEGPPYYQIQLKSTESWSFQTDGEISVAGKWGYSESAPDDIVHACIRLAGYYYQQKDAQVFDVTAQPQQGQLIIPKGIPADVKQILDRYVRYNVR